MQPRWFRLTIRQWMILVLYFAILSFSLAYALKGRSISLRNVLSSYFSAVWIGSGMLLGLLILLLDRPSPRKGWMAINIGLWMNFAAFFSFAVAADHELKQMHYPGVFSNKAWPAFLGALFLAAILNGTIRFKCPNCGRRAAIPYVVFFGPHLDKSIRWCGRCGLKFRPLARGEWEKVGEDEARSKTSASSRNPGRFLEAKKAELARCISLLAALSS